MYLIASLNYSQQELEEHRGKGEMLLLQKSCFFFLMPIVVYFATRQRRAKILDGIYLFVHILNKSELKICVSKFFEWYYKGMVYTY